MDSWILIFPSAIEKLPFGMLNRFAGHNSLSNIRRALQKNNTDNKVCNECEMQRTFTATMSIFGAA
jgi:hypothetical protein